MFDAALYTMLPVQCLGGVRKPHSATDAKFVSRDVHHGLFERVVSKISARNDVSG